MRKLLLLSLAFAFAFPVSAPAAQPVAAPEFIASFPALHPMEDATRSTPDPAASGSLAPDARVLLAAAYWLLIGAFVLRRRATRTVEHTASIPAAGWVLGYAPPLRR